MVQTFAVPRTTTRSSVTPQMVCLIAVPFLPFGRYFTYLGLMPLVGRRAGQVEGQRIRTAVAA